MTNRQNNRKKILTNYTNETKKKIQAYKFETPQSKKLYSRKIPIVKPRFTYNKYNLKHRQYHIIGLKNTKTQQTIIVTS